MWVAIQDLPRGAAHPFYTRLNQILDQHDFDGYVERLCQRFYAAEIARFVRCDSAILDGEIVCLDADGRSNFYALIARRSFTHSMRSRSTVKTCAGCRCLNGNAGCLR